MITNNSTTLGTTANSNFYATSSNVYSHSSNHKDSCTELYKQLLWYNLKKFGKDIITEEQHKNMLSMLNSNDNDTLELLRQILISKAIE